MEIGHFTLQVGCSGLQAVFRRACNLHANGPRVLDRGCVIVVWTPEGAGLRSMPAAPTCPCMRMQAQTNTSLETIVQTSAAENWMFALTDVQVGPQVAEDWGHAGG